MLPSPFRSLATRRAGADGRTGIVDAGAGWNEKVPPLIISTAAGRPPWQRPDRGSRDRDPSALKLPDSNIRHDCRRERQRRSAHQNHLRRFLSSTNTAERPSRTRSRSTVVVEIGEHTLDRAVACRIDHGRRKSAIGVGQEHRHCIGLRHGRDEIHTAVAVEVARHDVVTKGGRGQEVRRDRSSHRTTPPR